MKEAIKRICVSVGPICLTTWTTDKIEPAGFGLRYLPYEADDDERAMHPAGRSVLLHNAQGVTDAVESDGCALLVVIR